MAEGIDVYQKYQQVTDWGRVRAAGIEFAYVKVSDGTTSRYDGGYVSAGRAAGVKMGGYHYAQPGDPIAQADRLIVNCRGLGATDLAPALDLEAPFVPGLAARDFAIKFLNRVKSYGFRPCIYGNNSMLSDVLPAVRTAVPDVVVWAARYGGTPTVPHDVHQYADNGVVPGITGTVDRNRGTIPLNSASGGGSSPSTAPAPPTTQTSEDTDMDDITVGSSAQTTSVRVELSGGPNARIVIRPTIGNDGLAGTNAVWLGHVYAWGSDKQGIGAQYDPKNIPGYDPKVNSHRTVSLPGALWADVEYSSTTPFKISRF